MADSGRSPDARAVHMEALEPRLLLAADVTISEIMYQSHTESGLPENYGQEYVELYNRGDAPADLLGWKISDGVAFELPDVTLGAGEYLVVTANPAAFHVTYPGAANYISDYGWDGHLSNSGERIELVDAMDVVMDQVEYADEGDWADRLWEQDANNTFGYTWSNLHDGGGRSLEVINPDMTNNCGLNWAASLVDGGTPGAVNSVDADDIAPLIRNVEHYPIVPTASDKVTVVAKVQDELATGLTVLLRYRNDGDPTFSTATMFDDGLHDDGDPGDAVFAGRIDERPDGTIVEFYVEATDTGANTRTWPAPVATRGQAANCLYQVDNSFTQDWTPGTQPIFRAILTAAEWAYLDAIEDGARWSNAQMNVTFVTTDGVSTQVRYEAGMRNRGNGSRGHHPHNQRINIPHDRPWKGVTAVAMNARCPYSQVIASAIFRYADVPTADASAVNFLINGTDYADRGGDMYGSYVWLEALDSDMVANHWPDDDAGELYKCNDSNGPGAADLDYDGENPGNYNVAYAKQTNVASDDYSGLINMLDVLNEAPDETYLADVAEVVNIEQWVRFLAVDTLLANGEGGLTSGRGDDYAMYQGVLDPRFTLVPYDLDTTLGVNTQSRVNDTIWDYRRTSLHGLSRLLHQPAVAQMYYAQLLELCDTVFSPETLNPFIDQVLGGWVSSGEIDRMKQFAVDRVANVRGQVENDPLSVRTDLPVVNGYPRTGSNSAALSGTASGAYVQSVLVNGEPADWNLDEGTWALGSGEVVGSTVSFRNGVDGYASTVDTEIRETNPTGNLGGAGSIHVDGLSGGGVVQALIRFDDIFGAGAGQVAWDDTVLNATLTLNVTNTGVDPDMHRMVMPWLETDSWNSLGSGVQADGVEAAVAVDVTAPLGNTGSRTIDVTQAIRDWQADPVADPNYGWAMLPNGTDGADFGSSEAASIASRPLLTITIDDGGTEPGAGGTSLRPGITRLMVQAFDGPEGTGNKLDETYIDIWSGMGTTNSYSGNQPVLDGANLIVRDSYLPGHPVLVRIEALDDNGNVHRDLWDATADLSADNGVTMDVSQITMFNGLGSALVTFTGTGPFTLTANVNGMLDSDGLTELSPASETTVSGDLSVIDPGGTSTWSGIIHVTGDVLVPTGHTLNIQPGTLIRIDGVASGSGGTDIDVEGNVQSLGTEDQPITFTAYNSAEAWGEIHHSGADPSLYQYTNIIIAGHSPGGGHTGAGPAFRPAGSTIVFEHTNFTDNAGKVMQSSGGSDLTFRYCHLARSVMGPEISGTALLFEDTWITENHGPNDNDGIYIHSQSGGQDCTLRRGVIADMHDDGLDTLNATVLVEDYIFRNMADKGVSVYGGEVTIDGMISVNNGIGISAKDGSHAVVHIDHATISQNTWGVQAENKGGGMGGALIEYFITNSIVYGNTEWAVRSDYELDPILIDYSIVGPLSISDGGYRGVPDVLVTGVWPGTSNASTDPMFVLPGSADFRLQPGSPALDAGSDGLHIGYYTAPSGELPGDTIWRPEDGQYRVVSDLTVPTDCTLTIMPGTTVFFEDGAGLIVEGRLLAEGTADDLIHFASAPGASNWDGIRFVGTEFDNRITYAVVRGSTRTDGMIELDDSNLLIDHATFEDADRRRITSVDSSLIVRNSTFADFVFPNTTPNNVAEHIWGRNVLPGGQLIVENNVFGLTPGHNDAMDFDAGHRSAGDPVPQILNNTFQGGGDDALDIEGDFHIEGNVFMHYHKDAEHDAVDGGESNVISAGDAHGFGHDFVVTRNVFYDIDHVTLIKQDSFMTFTSNTVVNVNESRYAAVVGALLFDLPGETSAPGEGAYLDGNIFAVTPIVFNNVDSRDTVTDLVVNRSILPVAEHRGGEGNIDADARLADPAGGDFSLQSGSPAVGTGPVGLNMGADVESGALVSPAALAETRLTDATFDVSGDADPRHAGFLAYKYRLNGAAWSAVQAPGTQIALSALSDGPKLLEAIAQNSAGVWQGEADAVARSWTVDTALSRVLINEVLAWNRAGYEHELTYPDVIELYNDSAATADLTGWSITDDLDEPAKFVFPQDTTIVPEGYLLLFADDLTAPSSGIHLGFRIDAQGDDILLLDDGGAVVDSIEYGLQIMDLSIGRVGPDRAWALTQPTLDPTGAASANVAAGVTDGHDVLINEWFTNGDVVLIDDFIELYNPETMPADISGMYLTDNPANQKTKHRTRDLSFIAAEGFQALKADGRDDPGHLDFRLRANMEILGLFDADVAQLDRIYYTPQSEDVSQGRTPDGTSAIEFFTLPTPGTGNVTEGSSEITTETLVAETDAKYALVPTGEIGADWRTVLDPAFNTAGWHYWDGTPPGVGYESGAGNYGDYFGLDVEAEMDNTNATCYIRIPFTLTGDPADVTGLSLNVRYDDGFLAYLNGEEIHRANFPVPPNPGSDPVWNSGADDGNDDGAAVNLQEFDVTDYIGFLDTGENLLAIHALNAGASSSDFLISAELVATTETPIDNPFEGLLAIHDGLRITEIMYNPPGGDDDEEFIELQNTGSTELQLEGVRFTDGFDFVFPEMTLNAGEYIVVACDLPSFQTFYPAVTNVIGSYGPDKLSNGGEDILLQMPDPYEAAILRFDYSENWYESTDGHGASLVIVDQLARRATWDDREAWYPSGTAGGSPGGEDPVPELPFGSVVVNELLAHSDDPIREDWIELHNTTGENIDISGWFISDDAAQLDKFVIPGDPGEPFAGGNTILPAGRYVAFNEVEHFGIGANGFALSEHGEIVFVSSCDGTGALSTYRTFVIFGATANSVTLGRHVLTTGEVDFVAMSNPTYGAANDEPLVGPVVVDEIMYHPEVGSDEYEYILLKNISGGPVDLYDPANPENTWTVSGGTDFVFPAGIEVLPDGLVLITGVEPAAYLATHTVGAGVQVFGPFIESLSDGGDTITVSMPGVPETDPHPFVPYIVVETVKYNDRHPWPEQADGGGPALARLTPDAYGNEPANWGVSGPPALTVDPLTTPDTTPELTGTVADRYPPATVDVTVDGTEYTGVPVTGGTWTLADDTIAPALAPGTYDVTVKAGDAPGNMATHIAVDALAVYGAPTGVDLVAEFDSGQSDADNVTNLDNSNGGSVLEFDVFGTVDGLTVRIYAGDTEIGTATATGATTTVTTDGSSGLPDGSPLITATQQETGKAESDPSGSLEITIDTEAPALDQWSSAATHVGYGELLLEIPDDGNFTEPRKNGIQMLVLEFSEDVDLSGASAAIAGNNIDSPPPMDLTAIGVALAGRNPDPVFSDTGEIAFTPQDPEEVGLPDVARYLVQVDGVIADRAGNTLADDGDRNRIMTSLIGDMDGDHDVVDVRDLYWAWALKNQHAGDGLDHRRADMDLNGVIDVRDLYKAWARKNNRADLVDPVVPSAPSPAAAPAATLPQPVAPQGAADPPDALDAAVALFAEPASSSLSTGIPAIVPLVKGGRRASAAPGRERGQAPPLRCGASPLSYMADLEAALESDLGDMLGEQLGPALPGR